MQPQSVIGRYALYDVIASGGMATVYFGQLLGPVGFARTVAIKRLHPRFSRDPDFVSMFMDEARLAARIRHPNVVPVLDVVRHRLELYLVMEYVLGIPFGELLRRVQRRDERLPSAIVASVVCGLLEGLHAAHEARDELGVPLGIVHRDVSPSNVIVGRDGVARVLDFGVAKAVGRAHITQQGEVKGKPTYMAPEQLRGADVTRAADIHAVAVTLWEALAGRRAYPGQPEEVLALRLRGLTLPALSDVEPALAHFDAVIARGLARAPEDRWPTARAMADAIRGVVVPVTPGELADWLARECGEELEQRARQAAALESTASAPAIRAQIQADLAAEPSISLGDSEVELVDDTGSSSRSLGERSPPGAAARAERTPAATAPPDRDSMPTIVETTGGKRHAAQAASPAATVSSPTLPQEPPWLEESLSIARSSRYRSALLVSLVVMLLLAVGVGVFGVLARDEPGRQAGHEVLLPDGSDEKAAATTESVGAPAATAPEPPVSAFALQTSSASPPPAPSEVPAPTTRALAGPTPPDKPEPTAASSSSRGSGGPFDELGGRH